VAKKGNVYQSALVKLLLCAMVIAGCRNRESDDGVAVSVFCGAANKPALQEIAARFERQSGVKVEVVFGGSGSLLSRMELSCKGDIYLSGSPDFISVGYRKKLLIPNSDRTVAYLVPAIITPAGNKKEILTLEDLARPGVRIGIANPKTVCLGLYTVELLERNGLFAPVMSNVVTFGGSCSKTANLAAMGMVDAVIGWSVFHDWNPAAMEIVPIAAEKIPRISYVAIAIPVFTKDRTRSQRFIDYVMSDTGKSIYERFGYLTDRHTAQAIAHGATTGGEYHLPPAYYELINKAFQAK
jgi:molybdate transport system substrate-binding protein